VEEQRSAARFWRKMDLTDLRGSRNVPAVDCLKSQEQMPKTKGKCPKIEFEVETIPVVFFREGDTFIAHSPVLDLSACGADFEQAKRNFEDAVAIFFSECLKRGTLEQALTACGWTVESSNHKRKISPPVYIGQSQITVSVPEFA
jgi:hypothetical protein